MKSLIITAILLIGATVSLSGCADDRDALPVVEQDIPFRTDGSLDFNQADGSPITSIAIEIAESDSAKARGLMSRRSLPSQSGMLFPYDEEDTLSFWMRNTPMPLDIIFADGDGWVVSVSERTRPYSDDQIVSERPAQYAVEVRAGFAQRHNITADSVRIEWRRN